MVLIKNSNLLTNDFFDGIDIIDRTTQRQELITNLFDPIKNGQVGHSLYIYGMPGTGKTFVTKNLIKNLEETDKFVWAFFEPSIGNDTEYTILSNFIRNYLRAYMPINLYGENIEEIPMRGWDTAQLYQVMWHIIEINGLTVLIIIDEIDKIIKKCGDDFLQKWLDSYNILKNGNFYFIGISNDPGLDRNFSLSVKARYKFKILFPKYSAGDLLEILKFFSEKCLPTDSYELGDLAKIAKAVANYSGSARDAKTCLYNLALSNNSNSKLEVSEEKLKHAIERSEIMMQESNILSLPYDEKLILLSVIDCYKEYMRVLEKRGEKIARVASPITGTIYNYYKRACNTFGPCEPKNMYGFKRVLKEFDQNGLINMMQKSFGRRGLSTEIIPLFTIDVVEPMLLNKIKEEM